MPRDSNRTRIVTVDTVEQFSIPIKTVCLKDLLFLFMRQQKLWNDAQLRIAMVTRFSWYFAVNTTAF